MDTKKLRQKILDLAMRGKLVPQDPNDEPASVLLERIKEEKERQIQEGKIKRSKKPASADTSHYENIPFEIPENWCWTTIGNVFNLQAGKFIKTSQIFKENTDNYQYPCFGGNGLRGYVSDYNREGFFPLIGRQGALCGNINLVSGQFYATEHAVVVETFGNMNCYWSSYALKFLNLNQYATATAQPGLSVKTINEIYIPIPPLAEQDRIVIAIEKWFSVIDQLEINKTNLRDGINRAKSKILDLAIHGKLVPQDPNDEPAIDLLRRINPDFKPCDNAHYRNLPKGWQEIKMGEICRLTDGKRLENESMIYLDAKFLREKKNGRVVTSGKYIPQNSTLILVDGENSGEIFTSMINGYQGSTFKILNISEHLCKGYVLLLIKNHQKFLREHKVGSAIPHLNKKIFERLIVSIPAFKEQERIVRKVSRLFNMLDCITAEL